MKKIIPLLTLLLCSTVLMAQNFPYEAASQAELDMKSYDKDTSANAVVLNEYGRSEIKATVSGDIRMTYEYHVKIKIFNQKAFRHGTIELHLANNEDNSLADELDNLVAMTTYKDDNGTIQVAKLDKKDIYKTRYNKFVTVVKFAMPGLRDGCVIDYQYITISPFFDHLHSWAFQGALPKINTTYEARIPGFWTYNVSLRGPLKLSKSSSDVERSCFSSYGATCDCLKLDYAMTDVPAFIIEEHMSSPKNYLAALNFDLIEYSNLRTGAKTRVTKEWNDVDRTLKDKTEFGAQLKKIDAVKEHIPLALLNIPDSTQKAKALYTWVQKWFKWNNFIGIYSLDGIKKAIEAHTGSVADINITLVNALNAAGLNANAVLLSTREHGFINKLYPVIGEFDYVVARVTIGDKSWFMDASDPLLPFGMLSMRCLNDQGRVFSLDKPSFWVDMDTKQRRINTMTLDLTLHDDGKLKGKWSHFSQGYDAYLKRRAIKKFNSTDEYVESVAGQTGRVKILKSDIPNIDSLDNPINEDYDIELDVRGNLKADRFVINPYIFDQIKINPFRLKERSYPVDMGMPSEDRYIVVLHVPAQYVIENKFPNQTLSISDKDGLFATSFDVNETTYTFSSIVKLPNTIYPVSEYPYLKEFFSKIILAEKSNITFRKR
ncbi:MAG TPA: DUF3857 domain-containing protein [Mucilaginibacter sp.]